MEKYRAIPEGYMKVGEMAKKAGVTVRTLQYYDKEGLLPPSAESDGGFRLYSYKDLAQLIRIITLKQSGFSLNDIKKRLISLDTPADAVNALNEQAEETRRKIKFLSIALNEIESLKAEIEQMAEVDFGKFAAILMNLQMKNRNYRMIKLNTIRAKARKGINMVSVSMKNVVKAFGENKVLKGVTFETHDGEIFGMLGPSGSGKTTIINILTKQLAADGGECHVSANSDETGLLLEHDGLFNRLSCLDNLIVFEDIYGIPRKRTVEALEKVGLTDAKKTVAAQLSKGMRQRLVLARAILHRPKILFLDEPTSALDPLTARGIHQLIRDLRGHGSTVFLTTHNMEEATFLCDRVVLLHNGTIIEQGAPKDICERHNAVKTMPDLESVFVQLTGGGSA